MIRIIVISHLLSSLKGHLLLTRVDPLLEEDPRQCKPKYQVMKM